MSSPCAKHPVLHPVVGVCASCLEEKLATCVSNLKANGEEEAEDDDDEFSGSSITVNKSNLNSSPRKPLSHYLEDKRGVYSNCKDNSSHKKSILCEGVYEESSFYGSHYYARKEGRHLRGEGAKESPLFEKEKPCQKKRGGAKESPLCEKGWLSVFFSKRGGHQKTNSREGSIAPWRESESGKYEYASHHYAGSITWDAPRPSSWEQLSSWEKPSLTSPLKLASLLSSHSPSSPLKLPPHIISQSSPSSPLKLPPLLTSQSSIRSSLKFPPLLGYQPPLSPLKPPSKLGSQPTIASDIGVQVRTVSSQIETNQRSGHSSSPAQPKKKSIWFRVLLRNKWTVRFKRHFAKKERQEEADSARTSSAKESDYHRHSQNHSVQARHSQNHCFKEKVYSQNQQFSTLNRPSRGGSVSGRDYGAWDSYYSPVHSHSFNGVQARHRYNSLSCVQRGEGAELLRLYLTPVRGPSFCSKIRSF